MSDTQTAVERPQNLLRVNRPYRGSYRSEVDEPDTNTATPETNPDGTSATGEPGTELSPEEKVYKARYDSLKSHYDRKVNEFKGEVAKLREQLGTASVQTRLMPKTVEELEAWRNSYPDLYAMLLTIVRGELKEKEVQLNNRISEVESSSATAKRDKAEANLMRLHPDLPDLLVSEDFHAWVKSQPLEIQRGLYENTEDYLLAARYIDLYKADKARREKKPDKSKKGLKDAATAVNVKSGSAIDAEPSSQGKTFRTSEIAKMTRNQYESLEAEIDKARQEGRLIIDS